MLTIIARLIGKPLPAVDTRREELLAEMQIAIQGFRKALEKYERNTDTSVAYSQMLFAEIEVYRESYYEARMEYERAYGDATRYSEKLTELQTWMKERNHSFLFKHPHEMHVSAS